MGKELSKDFEYAQDQLKENTAARPLEDRIKEIALAARVNREHVQYNQWIENDEDGFTGWRWDKYKSERRIVCSANRYKDYIVTGARHYCPQMNAQINLVGLDALRAYAGDDYEQGFMDQRGVFISRQDALILAIENGQMRYNTNRGRFIKDDPEHNSTYGDELFSENLW